MKRRTFIRNSGLASGTLFIPSFLKSSDVFLKGASSDKKLVIIQLSGGNDGLNTLVPYTNDIYYKNRKSIALVKNNIIPINDELGLHSSMKAFNALYDAGYISIIQNVGYPNPNRSHFRSTDIWQTASNANDYLQTGWVGRYLDEVSKSPLGAIEVDDTLSLLLKGENVNGLATKDARLFYKVTRNTYFGNALKYQTDPHLSEHNLGYLYKTMISAKSSASYIYEKTKTNKTNQEYPANVFGKQLKTISNFINSGLTTQIYYASLGGFDTHANQPNRQARLLTQYSEGLSTFVNDLKSKGAFKNTLILTFSEFGRRVKQNAARGTDHGAANLVFLTGESLKNPGLFNTPANLLDLDKNGDIKYEIDFREIYATILENWLGVASSKIISEDFKPLSII
ncbi:DUF1501 domain-containing protein [Spongiivirga sp. MCCC 1A20706]|uniref:DUF1501 domain-containing protein n=1 Tax=Spongiivirga sp. MCCC 1A20706 TaxID=3160963 RepID=UPI003977DF34